MVLVELWVPPKQRLQGLPGAHPVCFGALFWSDVVHAHKPARGFPHILTQSFFSSLLHHLPVSHTLKTAGRLGL